MYDNPRRLRRPEERVGQLTNADLPPPNAQLDDAALVAGLRARDETAFEQLIDRHFAPMLRLAQSFVRSREEAEEVVQETWLAVLAGVEGFEFKSSFRTWLFRILVNRARTRGKREARSVTFSAMVPEDNDGATPLPFPLQRQPDPEAELLNRELGTAIEAALETLPPDQRSVITLRDVEGWSSAEVCDALGLTPANQRVLLHRARMRMRTALAWYVSGEDSGTAGDHAAGVEDGGKERSADCSADLS